MTTDCYYSPCRIIIFHAMLSTMLRVIIFDNTRDKYLKRIKKNISDKKISIINPIRIAKKKKTIDHSRRYVISIKHFLIRIQTSPPLLSLIPKIDHPLPVCATDLEPFLNSLSTRWSIVPYSGNVHLVKNVKQAFVTVEVNSHTKMNLT